MIQDLTVWGAISGRRAAEEAAVQGERGRAIGTPGARERSEKKKVKALIFFEEVEGRRSLEEKSFFFLCLGRCRSPSQHSRYRSSSRYDSVVGVPVVVEADRGSREKEGGSTNERERRKRRRRESHAKHSAAAVGERASAVTRSPRPQFASIPTQTCASHQPLPSAPIEFPFKTQKTGHIALLFFLFFQRATIAASSSLAQLSPPLATAFLFVREPCCTRVSTSQAPPRRGPWPCRNGKGRYSRSRTNLRTERKHLVSKKKNKT